EVGRHVVVDEAEAQRARHEQAQERGPSSSEIATVVLSPLSHPESSTVHRKQLSPRATRPATGSPTRTARSVDGRTRSFRTSARAVLSRRAVPSAPIESPPTSTLRQVRMLGSNVRRAIGIAFTVEPGLTTRYVAASIVNALLPVAIAWVGKQIVDA